MNIITKTAPSMVVADPVKGRLYDAGAVSLTDKIIHMKNGGKTWEIIDVLVDAWTKQAEESDQGEFDAYKAYLQDTREVQKDPTFGRTQNQDQDRRYVLSMPVRLMTMIRAIFNPRELIMDKEFFIEFAKRYPLFKVPEKL